MDAQKEVISLLHKGRVENTAEDLVMPPADVGNLLNLMLKSADAQRGWSATGLSDQVKKMSGKVAEAAHQSASGRSLLCLLVLRFAEMVREHVPGLVVDVCEIREADSLVQNSRFTFMEGKLAEQPNGWRVAIAANDQDILTELCTRPESDMFLQIVSMTAKRLDL
jgi:hypothetical protein